MVISTLALLAGICVFQLFPQLPDTFWAVPLSFAVIGCWRHSFLKPCAIFILAFLYAWWSAHSVLSNRLTEDQLLKNVLVEGVVSSIPQGDSSRGYRFILQTTRLQVTEEAGWQKHNLKVRLRWYRRAPALVAGDVWQLRVRLKSPRGLANPGGFDYERWLFVHRIDATGYVRQSEDNRLLKQSACRRIACWRQVFSRQLATVSQTRVSGLVRALVVGDKSGIDDQQWKLLRDTGTAHLMAISGLHIGLVAGLAFAMVRRLWGWSSLVQYWPAPKAAAITAILAAGVYALLAGFQLPTQRALIMVTVIMTAILTGRSHLPWRVFCIALCMVLLIQPLAVLSAGFWLSFGAVAWIFYQLAGRHGETGRFHQAMRIQLALSLGLLPVLLLGFQQTSLVAPLANLLAIPVVGLLVVPMLLLGCLLSLLWLPAGALLINTASLVLLMVHELLAILAAVPLAVWQQGLPAVSLFLSCIVGTGLLLAPAGTGSRLAGLVLLSATGFSEPSRVPPGVVRLTVLDVGQGLSAVIQTRRHSLVFDTGPRSRSGFDTGAAVLVPFLTNSGIRSVDRLIISHSDNDHMGGAASLFAQLEVNSILSGMPEKISFARASRCQRGQYWRLDNIDFEILAPFGATQGNNASCVLRITTASGERLLLTGDIEATVEKRLLANNPGQLQASVIVAPHHGSRTSSTRRFVEAVNASVVIFPAGYHNRFGFPKADVVKRYSRQGTQIYMTGRDGAVSLLAGQPGTPIAGVAYRQQHRHYWQANY